MKSLFHTSVPQKKAASFQAAQTVDKPYFGIFAKIGFSHLF